MVLLLSAAVMVAQRTPANPGTGSGSNPGSNPGAGTPPSSRLPTQDNSIPGPQQSIIFLSGRVMMDDGSPAPNYISIQRVCAGNPRTVAYTDSKGRFSFQWGDATGILPDASEPGSAMGPGGRMGSDLPGMGRAADRVGGITTMGCELRANAAGFRSDSIDVSTQRALDRGDVGTIVLHRLAEVEGRSISATSLLAPKDAAKAYGKGLAALTKNKPAEAQKDLEKAVEIYPKYASAWYDLGRARRAQHDAAGAREAQLKAIENDDKLVGPYAELGEMAANEQKWDDTAKYLNQALHLDPVDYPQLWFMDAVANYNMMQFDAAERGAREALKADPQHRNPRVSAVLGLILARKGDRQGAAEALNEYLRLAPNAPDAEQMKQQLAAVQAQ
jgi:Flp pilus assembly protein TadD